jgi:hypothetical protein
MNVSIGDLLVGLSEVYRVLAVHSSPYRPEDPYLEVEEWVVWAGGIGVEVPTPTVDGFTLMQAKEWQLQHYTSLKAD